MYIAVKGGEAAIDASRKLLASARRGDVSLPESSVAQIQSQLGLLTARVMAEGSLYDGELAALAIKQAQGDAFEAAFLLRAYRTTLPRLAFSEPLRTECMRVQRRVSAIFKDLPGGQVLGPTFDYTQRLLDFSLLRETPAQAPVGEALPVETDMPHALAALVAEGLVEPTAPSPGDPAPLDITRDPPAYPLPRCGRLQMLARADEGWLLGMGYSTQRGHAQTHPFGGDIRLGAVAVEVVPDELDFAIEIGRSNSPNARWSTSSSAAPTCRRSSRVVTAWSSATASARRWQCRWSIARCAPTSSASCARARRRTRSSCCRTATASKRRASCST